LFQKQDLLKDHLRERFYVTSPGIPSFTGLLINVSVKCLEFGDVKYENTPMDGDHLYIDRHPGTYLQRLSSEAG
jgi:hypothetical protein